MSWPKIVLIVWLCIAQILLSLNAGKPREATTPGTVAFGFAITAGLIALVVIA